jgi:hypothetical protein
VFFALLVIERTGDFSQEMDTQLEDGTLGRTDGGRDPAACRCRR